MNSQEILAKAKALADNKNYKEALEWLKQDPCNRLKSDQLYLSIFCTACDNLSLEDDFFNTIREYIARYPKSHNPFILKYYFHARRGDLKPAYETLLQAPLPIDDNRLSVAIVYKAIQALIHHNSLEHQTPFKAHLASNQIADKVCICMMVRDEQDIIRNNLEHHYKLGIRKFFILNNLSTDQTENEIRSFSESHPGALVVTASDPVQGYFQSGKTRALCEFASSYCEGIGESIKYVFPLDADEFVVFEEGHSFASLQSIMSAETNQYRVATFDLCDATSSQDWLGGILEDLYGSFCHISYKSENVVTKNLLNVEDLDGIEMGNHTVNLKPINMFNIYPAIDIGGRIIHLAYRSSKHVESKILNGGIAYKNAKSVGAKFGGHWRKDFVLYQEKGNVFIREKLDKYRENVLKRIEGDLSFNYRI